MFDKDISMAAYQGVLLHRKDGTEYWKLRLTCTHEPCPNEIEMGECLCFSTEEAMIHARDDHGTYCCAKHWAANTIYEKVRKVITEARKCLRELDSIDRGSLIGNMKDDMAVVDAYWQHLAEEGCYDGSEFFEEFDVEDCPI